MIFIFTASLSLSCALPSLTQGLSDYLRSQVLALYPKSRTSLPASSADRAKEKKLQKVRNN